MEPLATPSSSKSKLKVLLPLLLVVLVVAVVFVDSRRRAAEARLAELSVQLENGGGNTEQNREKAQEIVARVGKHIAMPEDVEPTVATIVDVKKLQEKNPFYLKAQNGDYLIVTPTRAILYRSEEDLILDVVPVQIEPQEAAEDAQQ